MQVDGTRDLVGKDTTGFASHAGYSHDLIKMIGLSEELSNGDPDYEGSLLQKYINFSLGTIIPVVLLVVFLSTVYQIYL